MKNFVKYFGIIALVALIGFSMVACSDDGGGGGPGGGGGGGGGGGSSASIIGMWEDEAFGWNKLEFTSSGWTYYAFGLVSEEGIYTINGNTVTLTTPSGDKPNLKSNIVTIINSNTIRWGVDDFHRAK